MKFYLFTSILLIFSNICFSQSDSTKAKPTYARGIIKGMTIQLGTAYLETESDFLKVKTGRPSTFNLYFTRQLRLIKYNLTLNTGMGVGSDSYFFKDKDLYIDPVTNNIISNVVSTGRFFKKNKLNLTYLDVPLELQFAASSRYKRAFKIALGGKVGLLVSSKNKVVYEEQNVTVKTKTSFRNSNNFRYGITGRVGIGVVSLFAYYGISDIFDKDVLYGAKPIIFGISLSSF